VLEKNGTMNTDTRNARWLGAAFVTQLTASVAFLFSGVGLIVTGCDRPVSPSAPAPARLEGVLS
jgi:hypothetical protein